MTDEEWEKLQPLADKMRNAANKWHAWGASNTPTEPRECAESYILGLGLHRDFVEAETAYALAVRELGLA